MAVVSVDILKLLILLSCGYLQLIDCLVIIKDRVKLKNVNSSVSDFFGSSVAMNKDFIAIGKCKDDVDGKLNMGSVTIFMRHDTEYKTKQKIFPNDGSSLDLFGLSVALSGNFLLVGSPQDDDDEDGTQGTQGSAYFYEYIDSVWTFRQKVVPENVTSSIQFGVSVVINNDIAVIGGGSSLGKDSEKEIGTCHVYKYNGSHWSQIQRLITKDNRYDNTYGTTVAISDQFIVLGLSYLSINDTINAGMVFIYKRNSKKDTYFRHQILFSSIPSSNGWFGRSVSIDDKFLAIGAEGENSQKGNVYIYKLKKGFWELETNLKPIDTNHSHHFGFAVSINSNVIAVASKASQSNVSTGIPVIFKLSKTGRWIEHSKMLANGLKGYDLFGSSLVVYNGSVVVGIYSWDQKTGSAYLFNIPTISTIGNSTFIKHSTHRILDTGSKQLHISPHNIRDKGHKRKVLIAIIIPIVLVVLVSLITYKYKSKIFRCRGNGNMLHFDGVDNIGVTADDVSLIANTQA